MSAVGPASAATSPSSYDAVRRWIDANTGEECEGPCPHCVTTKQLAEDQVRAMEMERRSDRAARTKAERMADRALVAKRDGATWNRALAKWLEVFPEKEPRAKGIKSARATKFFQRLESGATPEDVEHAIMGAKVYPYVVYGKRRKTGSTSDLASDLQDIVSVGNDAQFDFLVSVGRDS